MNDILRLNIKKWIMKKIMFNDKLNLTQAVLDSRKTQTRRIIPKDFFSLTWDEKNGTLWYENNMGDFIDVRNSKYALYKVGEVVAVAQSYRDCGGINKDGRPNWDVIAEAKGTSNAGWNNKMFVRADLMPHQIRITSVRIERLQDISDEDCLKEGVVKDTCKTYFNGYTVKFSLDQYNNILSSEWFRTPREAFAHLINKVSRKDTWESNPYVFVYDFEVIK